MQYGLEEVFKHSDPANARTEVQGLQVDDEPFPGRPGQDGGRFRLHRPQVRDGHYHEYERHQPDGPAPAGWPAGPVRRSDSGAARKSISDSPRTSATKGKEEEQWLGI